MLRSNPSTDPGDRGSAALEFILVGLILLVPLVYVITALGLIQGQALGAEAGARHIARAVATAEDGPDAQRRADRILGAVVREYGLAAGEVDLRLHCRPAGPTCPAAGATVTVTLSSRVALPLVPPVLGWDRAAAIPIEASASQRVSRFWGGQ